MRSGLEALYRLSGALGASFLVLILLVVVTQVCLNIIVVLIEWATGRALGLLLPSYATFAGYFLAAGSFLALGYTFARGAHIRVALVLQTLPQAARRPAEIIAALAALLLALYATRYLGALTHESWRFGDRSSGLVSIPLWIPQSAMTAGMVILCIATADRLVQALQGRLLEDDETEPTPRDPAPDA